MLSKYEFLHLIKNNYVFIENGLICITEKLWIELLKNKDNQKLINSLKTK